MLEILMKALRANGIKYDFEKIERAYRLAEEAHKGQKRESGDDYISHPVNVAVILSEYGSDTEAIVAALLHDTVEDTEVALDSIKKGFGKEVAELVDGVTKLGKIPYSSKEEQQIETLRKMFLAMAKDIRVILIKLADRLHNVRTLQYRSPEKQRSVALETMEVYAPLAHRLGMQRMKHELEDLSIKYLDNYGYNHIVEQMANCKEIGNNLFSSVKRQIRNRLEIGGKTIHIESRVKHTYSIYRKMYMGNKDFSEIYDLYAIRIIVDTVTDCYNVLGVIHDLFKPIPGRFKDYISTPKQNMYQSLHTTVIGKEGIPLEVQIRTWDMHNTAELGIAAHWKYKSGIFGKSDADAKLGWVREFLEIQKDSTEPEEFFRTFKIDFFADEVFVFTPSGDVITLPLGATPIDFAYRIHSDIGNKMVSARVGGKPVEFSFQLSNGDIVEITTSAASSGPKRDWLKIAKTSEARTKIRQWFKRECREENIKTAKEELDKELRRNGIFVKDNEKIILYTPILEKMNLSLDEFYNSIGYGGLYISKIMPRLKDEYNKLRGSELEAEELPVASQAKQSKKLAQNIVVEGVSDCLTRLAKCCSPLPGDDIVGFITRGYGVSIHKADCPNVINCSDDTAERLVRARWDSEKGDFTVNIAIIGENRIGLMADISSQLAAMRINIHNLSAREQKDGSTLTLLTIDVNSAEHLQLILNKLSRISGVYSVERSGN
ncbi:MAG: bifunctional (p)ppGpp synthetase/guanosine-3',5'-bis(diphosphate) 3'-pyrophosphohydrolase [Clostridia bacterium]|nr:bifunctional (p)ppGpp synthetase/guanosine-3',5'-bis(diphosphate) 3'-pyrophosphohydrolase [Clostridia bacterium]